MTQHSSMRDSHANDSFHTGGERGATAPNGYIHNGSGHTGVGPSGDLYAKSYIDYLMSEVEQEMRDEEERVAAMRREAELRERRERERLEAERLEVERVAQDRGKNLRIQAEHEFALKQLEEAVRKAQLDTGPIASETPQADAVSLRDEAFEEPEAVRMVAPVEEPVLAEEPPIEIEPIFEDDTLPNIFDTSRSPKTPRYEMLNEDYFSFDIEAIFAEEERRLREEREAKQRAAREAVERAAYDAAMALERARKEREAAEAERAAREAREAEEAALRARQVELERAAEIAAARERDDALHGRAAEDVAFIPVDVDDDVIFEDEDVAEVLTHVHGSRQSDMRSDTSADERLGEDLDVREMLSLIHDVRGRAHNRHGEEAPAEESVTHEDHFGHVEVDDDVLDEADVVEGELDSADDAGIAEQGSEDLETTQVIKIVSTESDDAAEDVENVEPGSGDEALGAAGDSAEGETEADEERNAETEAVDEAPGFQVIEVDDDDIFGDFDVFDNQTSFADVARRVIEQVTERTEEHHEAESTRDLSSAAEEMQDAGEETPSEDEARPAEADENAEDAADGKTADGSSEGVAEEVEEASEDLEHVESDIEEEPVGAKNEVTDGEGAPDAHEPAFGQIEVDDDDIFDDLDALDNTTSFADVARRVIERVSEFSEETDEGESTRDLTDRAAEAHDVEEDSVEEPVEPQEATGALTDDSDDAAGVAVRDESTDEAHDAGEQNVASVPEEADAAETDENADAEPETQAPLYFEVDDDEIFADLDSTTSFADLARRVMERVSEFTETTDDDEPTAVLSTITAEAQGAEAGEAVDGPDEAAEVAGEAPAGEEPDAGEQNAGPVTEESDARETEEGASSGLADEDADAEPEARDLWCFEVDGDETFDDLDSTTSLADLARRVMEQVPESTEEAGDDETTVVLPTSTVEAQGAEAGEAVDGPDEVAEVAGEAPAGEEPDACEAKADANPDLADEDADAESETRDLWCFEVDGDETFDDLDSTTSFVDLAHRVVEEVSERAETPFEEDPVTGLSSAAKTPLEETAEAEAAEEEAAGTVEAAEGPVEGAPEDQSLDAGEEAVEAVAAESDGEDEVADGMVESTDEGEGVEPEAQTPKYFEVDDDEIFDDISVPDNTTSFADFARRVIEQVADITEESSQEPVEDSFGEDPTVDLSAAVAAARQAEGEAVVETTPEAEETQEQDVPDFASATPVDEDGSAERGSEIIISEAETEGERPVSDLAEAGEQESEPEDTDVREQGEASEPALEAALGESDEVASEVEEANSSDADGDQSRVDLDAAEEDGAASDAEVEAEHVEEDGSADFGPEDEPTDAQEPAAETEAVDVANAISFDGEIDASEVIDEKIFDGLYIIPEGTPSEADNDEEVARAARRGGTQEPEDELSSVLNVSALIEKMYRQEVERSASAVSDKQPDDDEDDIEEPDLEGLVPKTAPVADDEAIDEEEPEVAEVAEDTEDAEGVAEEGQKPESDFVPVEVDDDDIFEDIDFSSALSAASVMFPVVYEEVRPEDDAELMRQATVDVEPAGEAEADATGPLSGASEGVVEEVLPVETIYNENQIREAVEHASQNDGDVDPTLVLDEAAEAVRRLRTVEEKAAVSVQAKAAETTDAPERDIHAEYIATVRQTERLEASYDPVSRAGDSKILKALGGGENNVFEHIGAFVVKVLHLDDKQG